MRAFIVMVLIAPFLIGLAGCASTADEAARAQRDVERMIQVYGPACERFGYQGDTDPWRNCVMTLSARDDLERYSPSFYGPIGYPYWSPYWRY